MGWSYENKEDGKLVETRCSESGGKKEVRRQRLRWGKALRGTWIIKRRMENKSSYI